MRARKLVISLSVAALVVLGGTAAPANAATGWDRCHQGWFCVFAEPNGQGLMAMYQVGDPNLGDAYGPQGMNNNIESVWNRTGSSWGLFKGTYGTGEGAGFGPGARTSIWWFANVASSIQRW